MATRLERTKRNIPVERKLSASESDSSDSDDQSDDGSSSGDESTSGSTSEGEKGLEKQRHEHKKLSTKTEAGLMKQKIVSRSKKVFAKQPSLSSESSDDQEQDSSKRKMKNSRKKNLSVNNGSNSSAEEKSHTEHRKRKRRRADSDSLDEKKLPKQEKDYIQRQQKVVHNLDGDRTKKYDDRNRRRYYGDKHYDRDRRDRLEEHRDERHPRHNERHEHYSYRNSQREMRAPRQEQDRRQRDRHNNSNPRDQEHISRGQREERRVHEDRRPERQWDRGKRDQSQGDDVRRGGNRPRDNNPEADSATNLERTQPQKEEPNFELSGKLTEFTNTFKGVVIKYNEPPEARKPKTRWRLYPFKGDQSLPVLYIHRQSAYLLGRNRMIADIPVDHPSCSSQHAVLQYRLVDHEKPDGTIGRRVKPYIIDLESSNGTFVNNNKIDARRYVELKEKDVLKFGFSSREYVILHDQSKDTEPPEGETEAAEEL